MVNSSEQRDFEPGGGLLKPRDKTDNDEQGEEGEEVEGEEREDERQGRAEEGEIAGDNSESNSRGSPSPERGHND